MVFLNTVLVLPFEEEEDMQEEEGAVILQQSNSLVFNIISLVFMLPKLYIHYFTGTIVVPGYQGFRWSLQTVMNVPGIPYVL